MKIDINALTYDELAELNHRIVERLKSMDLVRNHKEMMQFSPGDQVCFDAPGRDTQFGTLVKYNKKTVTVITESGQKWNISPHLLSKVKDVKTGKGKQGKIIDLHKK